MRKIAASFRLTAEALNIIRALAAHFGLSQAAILEMAVRDLARNAKISK